MNAIDIRVKERRLRAVAIVLVLVAVASLVLGAYVLVRLVDDRTDGPPCTTNRNGVVNCPSR
jgi:hypothetical protein